VKRKREANRSPVRANCEEDGGGGSGSSICCRKCGEDAGADKDPTALVGCVNCGDVYHMGCASVSEEPEWLEGFEGLYY
jgi:hypothetical protein